MQQVRAGLVHGIQNVFSITCPTPFLSLHFLGKTLTSQNSPNVQDALAPLFALNETTHG